MTTEWTVPNYQEDPAEGLVEWLHDNVKGNWDGDDSGLNFSNDHHTGNHREVLLSPGDKFAMDKHGNIYKLEA